MEHSVSPPAPRHARRSPPKGGSETVLLVEDDSAVPDVLERILRTLGYRALRARTGAAALEVLHSGVAVDLLLTGIGVRGAMAGTELAARARQLRPTIAVLFTGEPTRGAVAADGSLDPGAEILRDPDDEVDVARTIRHVLGNQQQVNALAAAVRESQRRREARRDPSHLLAVLLVDDQEGVRETSRQLLELCDCTVEAVDSAEAAEGALQRTVFDVLLTDLSLPGRSGIELARAAARLQPGIQVVLSSGYTHPEADAAAAVGVPVRVLPKPYGIADVEALLRELRSA